MNSPVGLGCRFTAGRFGVTVDKVFTLLHIEDVLSVREY